MTEPLNQTAEPSVVLAGDLPIGDAGSVKPEETAKEEPATEAEEPVTETKSSQETESKEEDGGTTFTDLKSVPPELKGIAKKLQADYTREMQKIAEARRELESHAPIIPEQPGDDEATASMRQFLETAEGSALKKLIMNDVANDLGVSDMRQKVYASEASKEIDQVVAKYGKDSIVEMMNQYPTAPLDMIASTVLFESAKERGAQEVRSKFQEKKEGSVATGSPSPVITPNTKVNTFMEAFDLAERQMGEK
jgi:hypothetical protein